MIVASHKEESLRELCQRLAWLLVGELGLSCRRVAAMLQRPVSTVCRWIRRARDVAAGVVRRRPGRPLSHWSGLDLVLDLASPCAVPSALPLVPS